MLDYYAKMIYKTKASSNERAFYVEQLASHVLDVDDESTYYDHDIRLLKTKNYEDLEDVKQDILTAFILSF